jgi:hypothetical protein
MGRRVFLDVGGHLGETLAEVVKPQWAFDRIWAFEPARACLPALETYADERTEIVNVGWWNRDVAMNLYDPGSIGASVLAAKAETATVERCQFVDAAGWMARNITAHDTVWTKVNCEAAEVEVLDRLLTSGEITKIDYLLVHFDIEKIPGMKHRADQMRARLRAAHVPFKEARQMLARSGLANWLRWTEAPRLQRFRYTVLNRMIFSARQQLYPLKRIVLQFSSAHAGQSHAPSRRQSKPP